MKELCQTLIVTESGYYRGKKNKITDQEQRDYHLTGLIKQIHHCVKGRYGSPRIHAVLKEQGEKVSCKRVSRLMRENNIYSKVKYKYKVTTYSKHNYHIAPNLLEQNFTAYNPNQVWVADITYIWTCEGWSVNDRITKELVINAFLKAYWTRKPKPGLIHHSDRGSQYSSNDFQKLLINVGTRASMSSKGNCYDNAVAESFFNSLKTEAFNDHIVKTKQEAKDINI